MLEYVCAELDVQLWSADDIREDSPEDAHQISGEHIGILFHSGDGHGALVIGTEQQIIDRMEQVITLIRRERAILDGTVVTDALRQWEAPR
jgi:hypothetical protein